MQMQQKHCTKSTIPWLILPQKKVDPVENTRSHRVHWCTVYLLTHTSEKKYIDVLLIVWWFKMNNPKHWSTSSIDIQTPLLDNLDQTCCVDETGPQCVRPGLPLNAPCMKWLSTYTLIDKCRNTYCKWICGMCTPSPLGAAWPLQLKK